MNIIPKHRWFILLITSIILGVISITFLSKSEDIAEKALQQQAVTQINQQSQKIEFIENQGQWQDNVHFAVRHESMSAWFEKDAITLRLKKLTEDSLTQSVVTKLNFEGASSNVTIGGEIQRSARRNYFLGSNRDNWQANVSSYHRILYKGLYDGIDLRVRDNDGILEYDLLLEPGADLEQVQVRCEGNQSVEIDEDGSLLIHTDLEPIRQKVPLTWYELEDGEKIEIACEYRLLGQNSYGFEVPNLNPELALVIDPGLEWATYVGGAGSEALSFSSCLIIAENGDAIICGRTSSLDFPTTIGSVSDSLSGSFDIFVTRWNPNLKGTEQLIWSTYIGGSDFDGADALTEDANGNIIIVGQTNSLNFPTTQTAFDTSFSGVADGFVIQLNASGNTLFYSTYVGGQGNDALKGLAVSDSGTIMIVGTSSSSDYPMTPDAYDTSYNSNDDIVVSQLDFTQIGEQQLLWSTFLGGSAWERVFKLELSKSGTVWLTGDVSSHDFPVTPNAYNMYHAGGPDDAYIAELDPTKSGSEQLNYATFIGGYGFESVYDMFVDKNDIISFTGVTSSENYPLTQNAFDLSHNGIGGSDIFVTQIDPTLASNSQLVYSTLLGGGRADVAYSMALDDSGKIYLGGLTNSSGFPVTENAIDKIFGLGTQTDRTSKVDGFLVRLNPFKNNKDQLEFSTFIGGDNYDYVNAIALDQFDNIFVGGSTQSYNFQTSLNAYDRSYNGGDVFLAKIAIDQIEIPATSLFVYATGEQQLPPVETNGVGRIQFDLNSDSTEIDYSITLINLTGHATGVFIHSGETGMEGPVVRTIFDEGKVRNDTTLFGTWSSDDLEPLSPDLVDALLTGGLYVNVQTDSFPSGEIRGQMTFDPFITIANAKSDVFYATLGKKAGDDGGSLIMLDPSSGAGTVVGKTGILGWINDIGVPALAINSVGELFASNLNIASLFRIDALTGKAIELNSLGIPWPEAMAFDMNDVLYAIDANGDLFQIEETKATAQKIGHTEFPLIRGMAFNPVNNTLWASTGGDNFDGVSSDAILKIDLVTAKATVIGKTGLGGATPGIHFDSDGNLFGVKGGGNRPNDLILIDKETAKATVVGSVGIAACGSLSGRQSVKQGPQISLNASFIEAGTVEVDNNIARDIFINNYGTEELIVSEMSFSDESFTTYNAPELPFTLQPTEKVIFEIQFSPLSLGDKTALFSITSNDAETPIHQTEVLGRAVDFNSTGLAEPGILYAASGVEDGGRLLKISVETGEASVIGETRLSSVQAMAINSKQEIFAVNGSQLPSLYQVDATTGAALEIANLGGYFERVVAMAIDSSNTLYGFRQVSATNCSFVRVDLETGSVNYLRTIEAIISGMAFANDGTLWVVTVNNEMGIYNVNTGEFTVIGQVDSDEVITALLFINTDLYGALGAETRQNDLIRIDRNTGEVSIIGSTGITGVLGLATVPNSVIPSVSDNQSILPLHFHLAQNYPNPFNPSTTIQYDLPTDTNVKIVIYDILGRNVKKLTDGYEKAGTKQIVWKGKNDSGTQVASGLYFYRIEAGDFIKTRKLMLIK